jgi:hypothetical protein
METVKIFVRPDNTATIICPACNAATQTSVAHYRHKKHVLKIRCKCNAVFKAQLDFRRHYRKQTSLPGTYRVIKPPGGGGGVIHIRNISQNGIGFTVSGVHHLQPGMVIRLEFTLNDKHLTKLVKEATVRLVEDNYIGCQFTDQDVVEKALGFYLRR